MGISYCDSEEIHWSYKVVCGLQDTHAVTGPAPFYMPTVEEALESVAKAKIISTIDLNKGYYQVKCISFEIMSVLGCCLPSSLWGMVPSWSMVVSPLADPTKPHVNLPCQEWGGIFCSGASVKRWLTHLIF